MFCFFYAICFILSFTQFTKSFWIESSLNRRQQFYWWANKLRHTFNYANEPIKYTVFRGLNKLLQLPTFYPLCVQPTSTTTEWNVANSFANGQGIIIESNSLNNVVCGIDVSILSAFHNEDEIWIYDQTLPINRIQVLTDDKQKHIDYIAQHLIHIDHNISSIKKFLRPDDRDFVKYYLLI